jgi:hypothetical protein
MIARASSGSRSSINSIDPLMSANSTVTVLRSPSRFCEASSATNRTAGGGFAATAPLVVIPASPRSAAAHWPQKSNPGGFSNEHLGQIRPSAVRHFPQNFMPAGLSNSHFEQRIGSFPNPEADARVSPEKSSEENRRAHHIERRRYRCSRCASLEPTRRSSLARIAGCLGWRAPGMDRTPRAGCADRRGQKSLARTA